MPLGGDRDEVARLGGEFGKQRTHRLVKDRMNDVCSHVAHRDEHESAFMLARVWNEQVGIVANEAAVGEQVKIESTWTPSNPPNAISVGFDFVQAR